MTVSTLKVSYYDEAIFYSSLLNMSQIFNLSIIGFMDLTIGFMVYIYAVKSYLKDENTLGNDKQTVKNCQYLKLNFINLMCSKRNQTDNNDYLIALLI